MVRSAQGLVLCAADYPVLRCLLPDLLYPSHPFSLQSGAHPLPLSSTNLTNSPREGKSFCTQRHCLRPDTESFARLQHSAIHPISDKSPPRKLVDVGAESEPGIYTLTLCLQLAVVHPSGGRLKAWWWSCAAGFPSSSGDQVRPHGAGVRPWRPITSANAAGSGGPSVAPLMTPAISRK